MDLAANLRRPDGRNRETSHEQPISYLYEPAKPRDLVISVSWNAHRKFLRNFLLFPKLKILISFLVIKVTYASKTENIIAIFLIIIIS